MDFDDLKNLFDKSFILTFIVIVLVRQIWIFSVIERDEGGIALVAFQWMNGLLPYVHSLNNAGPLAYLTYLVSTFLFGKDFIPIRMINNITFFLSTIALYLFVREWLTKKAALVSSLFYGIFMSAPIYEGQLALTSSLSAPILVFSVFLCGLYLKKGSKKALWLASFTLSAAVLIKILLLPTLFLLFGAVAFNHLHNGRRNLSAKKSLVDLLVVITGFSVLPMFFTIYFVWGGALGNLINVFVGLSLEGYGNLPAVPFGIFFYAVLQSLPLWIFAISGLAVTISRKRKLDLFLMGWLICAAVIAAFPPHFGHRYIYLIAPASIFAGAGIATILDCHEFGLRKKLNIRIGASWLIIVLLILSVPMAFICQLEQYPQYQIDSKLLDFHWSYADLSSYSTQTRLGEFLKAHCSVDGKTLVHGWAAEIYYLAGKLPPSKYVWTRPAPQIYIPESEYDRLTDSVKNREYEYVVIFDNDLGALAYRREDPIVDQVLRTYFYFGNISNALIFSKFDSSG